MTSTWPGARGILVNITAGPSLVAGEFTAVGETVAEFPPPRRATPSWARRPTH